jgi:site-specific DNA-methyltransferase (adenine-specific)
MKIEMMAIKLLKPYEKNPRLNAKAIPQVMKSLTEFGWRQPIVVDKDLVVIVGHTRLAAAKQMKLKLVPVHVADLTEAQVRAYRITDNRSHDRSEWDMPLLSGELDAIFDMEVKFDLEFMDFSLEDLTDSDSKNFEPGKEEDQGKLDEKKMKICPECGHEF